ncbi:hypothetical protein BO94DRAFT_576631 [Aspergillus sclerotioniger CBS 115572]|uniref:Uncharacterized protein n=1 Tax=Aspergillus sclerotioniger CBS 115572 TaxID=1450535 RepID=A0A317WC36_9EURO|nr:hypothetical protein BO94DRAFT_576631 [Aspergillus sclerotioniger CBS 115572]PWY81690.1 hypothetical protein BO94DRAFT_576631 [Aspergillus sclerotioniger CBS 115572]
MISTLFLLFGLIALCVVVRATPDKSYKPSLDFRPLNITGFWYPLYAWVGSLLKRLSYYNATLEFELTPTAFSSTNSSFWSGLQNRTLRTTKPSYLGITETSIWNSRPRNPVNLYLTSWPTDYDFWDQSLDSDISTISEYDIVSSNPVYSDVWFVTEYNNFDLDLTTIDTSPSTYRLSGAYTYNFRYSTLLLNLTSCNAPEYSDTWRMFLINQDLIIPGLNWTYPTIDVRFDNTTANLTINGQFGAYAYDTQGNETGTWMAGAVKMVFRGVVDNAKSDVLVQREDQPTWLRTLGFGNNSLNLNYRSGAKIMAKPGNGWMVVAMALFGMLFVHSWFFFGNFKE